MSARTLVMSLTLGMMVGACGGHAAHSPPSVMPTPTPSSAPSASPVELEVHEWGLVRTDPGDVLHVGAVPPPITFAPMVMEKPVLYFHAREALSLASVSVRIPDGSVAETWPFVPLGPEVRWSDVRIEPSAACAASPLPSASDAPCAGLSAGEACESSGLAVVRASDAACVTVGGTTDGFLFYRARVTRFTPPLSIARVPGTGRVRVTNDGDRPIPGVLVRIAANGGSTQTVAVAPPAPHASIEVGDDFAAAATETPAPPREDLVEEERMVRPSTIEPGRTGIARSLDALGLTAPERDAFLAAWTDALFGRPGEIAEQSPPPRESFVYFLPEPSVDALAPLTIDPPPARVRRAMAVWAAF